MNSSKTISALVLSLVVLWPAASRAEPKNDVPVLQTPDGVRFGLLGAKPAKPVPVLFAFATSLEDALGNDAYAACGKILARDGFLCVSLDLPCHGKERKDGEPAGLDGWRARLQKGDKLVPDFTARCSSVLEHLIKQGYVDPEQVYACGTSRGGFMALHLAAAEPRIRGVAAFAPVTNLVALREFASLKDDARVKALDISQQADKLAGRPIWICIGNQDDRVSTDEVIVCARRLVAASAGKTKAIPVELHVMPTVGHTIHATAHREAAAWIVANMSATKGKTPRASPLPKTTSLLERSEPVTIVCIGDSITGVYYHTGGRRAYPEILELTLRRAYPKAKVHVINAGISGNILPQGLVRLENDVLKHKPHLVTIMYGMNDLTRFSVEDFKKNLAEMSTRCRNLGAEVLLCTQNSIYDGPRSTKKLAEFTQAIHDVGREHKIPVADCHQAYEAVRAKDAQEWALLMSDEIHPNMDGHKLFARVIAGVITGKEDPLNDIASPAPAIPKTLSLLKAGKPIKVLAMPPLDKAIGTALKQIDPAAKVEVTTWPTEGQTIAQLEQAAKKVRGMGMDLVIVAVPIDADAESTERFIRSYSWVLNSSLSFGQQQWDVIAVPPSTLKPKPTEKEAQRDKLIRRLIAAQDLSIVTRSADDTTPLEGVLARWLKSQFR